MEAAVPAEVEAPAAEAPDIAVPDTSDMTAEQADTFTREYVEKIRREAASYRERAKPFSEAFDGISEEDREVFLQMAKAYKEDPRAAAEYFEQVTQGLKEQFAEAVAQAEDDLNRPLTLAEYNRLQAEHAEKAAQEAEIARIEKTAQDMGYDLQSPEYTTLLTIASRLPDGDIAKAHEKLESMFQSRIDAYIAKMAEQAEAAPAVPAGGTQPSSERQIHNFGDARSAVEARIAAIRERQ